MCNPVYGMPGSRKIAESILADPHKLPLIVSIDCFINESNAFADYIVPDSHMYETWGWVAPWNGVPTKTSAARWPVVEPRTSKTENGEHICMETFILGLAKEMNLPGFGPNAIKPRHTELFERAFVEFPVQEAGEVGVGHQGPERLDAKPLPALCFQSIQCPHTPDTD